MSSRVSPESFAVVDGNYAMLEPNDTGTARKVVPDKNSSAQDIRVFYLDKAHPLCRKLAFE